MDYNASPDEKDARIATLEREKRELEIVVAAGGAESGSWEATLRRERRSLERTWSAKVEALEEELEAQARVGDDLMRTLEKERKVSDLRLIVE